MIILWVLIGTFLSVDARDFSKQEQKYYTNLKRQCDDGIGSACFQYGKEILADETMGSRSTGVRLVRQACRMMVASACKYDFNRKPDEQDEGCEDNILKEVELESISDPMGQKTWRFKKLTAAWAKAGFRVGDVILKVGDQPMTDTSTISKAFVAKEVKFQILRNGPTMDLTMRCQLLP